jgi:hypothetical protein
VKRSRPALRLVQERKLAELIALPQDGAVLEASGVLARGRDCFVIFANVRRVARIDRGLAPGAPRHASAAVLPAHRGGEAPRRHVQGGHPPLSFSRPSQDVEGS